MQGARLQQFASATAIFDVEDRYTRDRGVRGRHPRPISPVRYFLVGRMVGTTRHDFDEPMELLVKQNPSGYDLFFNQIRMDDSRRYRTDVQNGVYVLQVKSRFYQTCEYEDVHLPEPALPYRIALEPGYAYPFPSGGLVTAGLPTLLRGTLHQTDGSGVADVSIEVSGRSNSYLTDDSGQWVLVFAEDDPGGLVTVSFTRNGVVEDVADVLITTGGEAALPQAGLRGWVKNSAGVGIEGAHVRVEGYPGETITGQDGGWFYYFGLNQGSDVVSVAAISPAGPTQTKSNIHVQPRSVVVVPNFQFT